MALVKLHGNGVAEGSSLWLWCPACEDAHRIVVGQTDSWSWDGNEEAPTISPSIKVTGAQWPDDSSFRKARHGKVEPGGATCCHSFVRSGQWEFLTGCTHDLAGQTVPMVQLPDWL